MSIIGSSLEAVRRDLKYMPTQTLIQYKQNPAKNAVDGIPMDMLAGLELSRRAQMQTELAAAGAQSAANMPTVTDAAVQQLTGQPQQPPAPMPQGAPQPAPQPQQAAPQPQRPQPQMPQQPPPPTGAQVQQGPMQQTPQGGLPTVKKATGGFIIDSPDDLHNLLSGKRDLLKTEGYAGGGIIAFANRGEVPSAYEGLTQEEIDRVVEQSLGMSTMPNPRAASAKRQLEMRQAMGEGTFFGTKKDESKGQKQIPIGDADSAPGLPPPMEESPSDSAKLLDSIIKRMGQGGGGGVGKISVPNIKIPPQPDLSAGIAAVRNAAAASPEETAAIEAYKNFAKDLPTRKSPYMSDADRAAAEDAEFKKRQEIYDPVNAETQRVLEERRAALEARRGRRLSEAGLQLGLGMLGGRGNLASIISGAGKEAVGAYQKGQELDDAQQERIQDMNLKQQQALAAQKAGNKDLAYQRTREAQADKVAIDNFEVAKQERGLGALGQAGKLAGDVRGRNLEVEKYAADVDKALKYQQLGFNVDKELAELKMGVTLKLAQMQQANDAAGMRQMLQIYGMLQKGEAAKIPTTADMERASRMIKDEYATADSPAVAAFVRGRENPDLATKYAQALRDARSGTAAIAEPAAAFLYNVQNAAKQSAMQDILRRSRTSNESSGGVRDYSDVAKSFGIGG
jgi:hypothetical protein